MLKKVAFTMFPIQDSTRARRFYEETLGLKSGLKSPDGVWTEYDLPEGGCLALFKSDHIKPSANSGGCIAFEVEDLDALVSKLKAAGVTILQENIAGPVCRMTNIQDSEGNVIILHKLQPKKA
jgi:predicted enzyme related to lactoylglutathione lyase